MIKEQRILYLNPRELMPSRNNVRSDPGDLAGLAETIREHGVLQPLGVMQTEEGYRVVYGNRRRAAAIVVGLERVPCVLVEPMDEADILVQQVLENMQRLELNDMDKAIAFDRLATTFVNAGMNQTQGLERIAKTLGLSVRQIQRYLRLNALNESVKEIVRSGDLGVTHCQHLADLSGDPRQVDAAKTAIEEGLSARDLARLCQALANNPNIGAWNAWEILKLGQNVPNMTPPAQLTEDHLNTAPIPEESDADLWADEDDEDLFADSAEGFQEPLTHDGNRVFRIHNMDSFMDEVERLTQCVQDGDLQKFLDQDPVNLVRLRLASRQIQALAKAVTALEEAATL